MIDTGSVPAPPTVKVEPLSNLKLSTVYKNNTAIIYCKVTKYCHMGQEIRKLLIP